LPEFLQRAFTSAEHRGYLSFRGFAEKSSQQIALCLFRSLQEALHNAIKHSGARRFDVSLNGTSSEILLAVHDSGVGFDPEKAISGKGLGLISMKERLKLVDGQLSIESKLQAGTTIHARVPLNLRMNSAKAVRQPSVSR